MSIMTPLGLEPKSEVPMDWTGCDVVEVVSDKVSGAPILKHSRVTADAVWESDELGESVEEIAYSFSLDPADIRRVLSFAAGVERHRFASKNTFEEPPLAGH